jgi:hypothetical protein
MGATADSKPPSLAGVEKFIRAKVAAEAAKNKQKPAAKPKPVKEEPDENAEDSDDLDLSDGMKEDDGHMDA